MVLGSLFAFTLTTVAAVAANLRVDGKLISTASTGAPIEVASETLVEHLSTPTRSTGSTPRTWSPRTS
jgi:hypothetical protein